MCEELSYDTEAIRLEAVDSLVVVCEALFEKVGPHAIDLAETFADHAVELLICAFLAGAFDDHGCEFVFEAVREVDAHELVTAFFEATAGLDREVDGSAQTDKIGVSLILDVLRLLLLVLLF